MFFSFFVFILEFQRWLTCQCGAAGPRDSSSARAILANHIWATSFENAKLAQEQAAKKSAHGRAVKAAWEALWAVVQRAVRIAHRPGLPQDWQWNDDAQRRTLLHDLEAAERELERVLELDDKQEEARSNLRQQ